MESEVLEVPEPDAVKRPRVILSIMLDDADFHDFGFNSVDAITPNIDALKNESIYFSEFYSGSSICSPTRVSLLTGDEPIKFGLSRLWPDVKSRWVSPVTSDLDQYYMAQRGLPDGVQTIANLSKSAGYETFHIGKWHAGNSKKEFWPDAKGFDSFQVMNATPYEGEMSVFTEVGEREIVSDWRSSYQADEIIDQLKNVDEDIFINWWPIEPHFPWYVPLVFSDELNEECCNFDLFSDRGKVLSMMYSLDREIGRVITELKVRGLFEDALILIFSDNGGQKSVLSPQRSLSGFKNTLSEGGIKVPLIASWPRVSNGAGTSHKIVTTMDVFSTFSEIFEIEENVSGESFLAELQNPGLSDLDQTKGFLWYLRPDSVKKYWEDERADELAYRSGCYKVIKKSGSYFSDWALYDLCDDPYELIDLSFAKPALHAQLGQRMFLSVSEKSQAASFGVLSGQVQLEETDLLDTHQDDITVTTDFISAQGEKSIVNIYNRGDAIKVSLDQSAEDSNRVVVLINGVSSKSTLPDLRDIELSGTVAKDGESHSMTFVAQGYLRTGTAFELFIDGQLVDRRFPVLDSESISESIYALRNTNSVSVAGDNAEVFSNYYIYKLAIRPSSPMWRQ